MVRLLFERREVSEARAVVKQTPGQESIPGMIKRAHIAGLIILSSRVEHNHYAVTADGASRGNIKTCEQRNPLVVNNQHKKFSIRRKLSRSSQDSGLRGQHFLPAVALTA